MTKRIVLILYSGHTGGAETVSGELAVELRRMDVDASVLFVCDSAEIGRRLDAEGVPWSALNMTRGADVVRHGRRYCDRATEMGADGAITMATGFLAGLLRVHGYPGVVLGVEHGGLLQENSLNVLNRMKRRLDRASGVWALNCQVGVSDAICSEILKTTHAGRVERIYNGVNTERFRPERGSGHAHGCIVGAAGRLVHGKGFDVLVRALAMLTGSSGIQVRIAGVGPEQGVIQRAADELGVGERVTFVGPVSDMAVFWNACDVAVVPSNELVESFGMCAAEAQACGIPVVVTDSGGLPEVVEDGVTGKVVPRGDASALAQAMEVYRCDVGRRIYEGRFARERVLRLFSIEAMALGYMHLLESCEIRDWKRFCSQGVSQSAVGSESDR